MHTGRHTKKIFAATLVVAGMLGLTSCGGGGYEGGEGSTSLLPIVSFSSPASAITINLGQSITLAWSSTYASSCTASTSGANTGAFSGMQGASGSVKIAPTAVGTATYMLSCTGSGGNASATSATITVAPSILSTLKTIATIGSTLDPIEHGGNPYGLGIAPITSGLITAGDLIACNFNDGLNNYQGQGTTVIGLHPTAGSTPYRIAQSLQLEGCGGLSVFPDDSIAVTGFTSNLVTLVSSNGTINNPFSSYTFHGPWGQVYATPTNGQPALYVSNQMNGTIDRISLNGDTPMNFTEIATGFCGSGGPGAIFAPAGLVYDASIDTLYIVDTSSYSVVAFANVSTIGADGVVINGSCSTNTPTPAPTFSGPSGSSARIIANGGQFNSPLSATLLMDGDLLVSNADINNPATTNLLFEISPALGFVGSPIQLDSGAGGALFGLAATKDSNGNQIIYFNDDNDNTIKELSQ